MMKFTDLNFDCLEILLEYLELLDLLNVADSTKRLRRAAQLVYARKYGNRVVSVDDVIISPNQRLEFEEDRIKTNDFRTSLRLLRCFGSAINNIQYLSDGETSNQCKIDRQILCYINTYCAEYLKDLEIIQNESVQSDLFEYFKKPFSALVSLTVIDCNFTGSTCINRLFPKLKTLDFSFFSNTSFLNVTENFCHLEKLCIEDFSDDITLDKEMVMSFLQKNTQLKELKLMNYYNSDNSSLSMIQDAVGCLQNLEILSLKTFVENGEESFERIRFENVRAFQLYVRKWNVSPIIPFSFKQLHSFVIEFPKSEFQSSFKEEFFNFINRHPTITHLAISNIENVEVVDWSRLAKSLPLLVEIWLDDCSLSIREASDIMDKFPKLERFFCLNSQEILVTFTKN